MLTTLRTKLERMREDVRQAESRLTKLWRTQKHLMQELGREPTPEEIADEMHLPVARVNSLLKMAQQTISLQAPMGEDGDASFGDFDSASSRNGHFRLAVRSRGTKIKRHAT